MAVFSTLDANNGYWKIEFDDTNKDKTAFTLHDRLYRFIRMPLELRNAPGTYQRTIEMISSRVNWRFALVHLHNIVIFSNTPQQRIIMNARSSRYCTTQAQHSN